MKETRVFDTIIVGAGPSGAQAGLYIARAGKSVLVMHHPSKGALVSANNIQNFYGVGETSGEKLYAKGIAELKKLGVEVKKTIVTDIMYDFDHENYVVSDNSNRYRARSIILAMGKEIPQNRGFEINAKDAVSYCATCDGFFYRNKNVAVIGNTEFTLCEHNHLLNVTSSVDVLTNSDVVCPALSNIENVISKPIEKLINTANGKVKVWFQDKSTAIYDGVFIATGDYSASTISKTLGVYVEDGFVVVNDKMSTNIPGVFACGDMIGGTFQIAKAVADGMTTGFSVISYLNDKK